jgi:gluconokinase
MPLTLLDSQLATLEPLSAAEAGVTLRATDAPASIVEAAVRSYGEWSARATE